MSTDIFPPHKRSIISIIIIQLVVVAPQIVQSPSGNVYIFLG